MGRNGFLYRPTKGLSPNIPGPRKSPANRIYYTVGLVRRYMENCLIDVREKFAFPYLGDVLVYSDDFDSRDDHLRKVFQILRENGIKVKSRSII